MKKLIIMIALAVICIFTAVKVSAALISAAGIPNAEDSRNTAIAPVAAIDRSAAETISTAAGDTIYGIGSTSKVFGAAAVMKLVDEGKIDLDEPVVNYIPEFRMADERYIYITPRMLLNHSSGLMGSSFNGGWLLGENNPDFTGYFLEALSHQRLKHDPGERSIYCNDGFTLAEILVERVSGMSFTDFIGQYFSEPLGLESINTTYSDFDRSRLADIYLGNNALQPENLHHVASGGIYSTMEDLCRFSTIFMDSADGSVLSKQSVSEMARVQHEMEIVLPGTDTCFRYGLGWDAVDLYPFNQYGIQALGKGGSTVAYHTYLTVLPEYNIAAAVSASGGGDYAAVVAQEIILAVLIEEGLLPPDAAPAMPELNTARALIPDDVRDCAGLYAGGSMGGMLQAEFTDYTLVLTPVASGVERPQEFLYNTDGVFVSTDGNYLGKMGEDGYGVSRLTFEGSYLTAQTYESVPGLGIMATSMPVAVKLEANLAPENALAAWAARAEREYLLVGDRHTSARYITAPVAGILTDARAAGYVTMGIYKSRGAAFPETRIVDENHTEAFQNTPTMNGRDGEDISVSVVNGIEYLDFKAGDAVYMDASAAVKLSATGDSVTIGSHTVWVDVDAGLGGQSVRIDAPRNGSWFVYDDRMNCVATSLGMEPRDTIILPENGRLAFAGDPGTVFVFSADW